MAMNETITYTVTTIGGSRQHTVEGMANNLALASMIGKAYRESMPGFFLPNPPTIYTISNVISVSFEGGTPESLDELNREIGFVAQDSADS